MSDDLCSFDTSVEGELQCAAFPEKDLGRKILHLLTEDRKYAGICKNAFRSLPFDESEYGDFIQDMCIKLLRSWDKVSNLAEEQRPPFICRMAQNAATDMLRRKSRWSKEKALPANGNSGCNQEHESVDVRDHVNVLLARLNKGDRALIEMRMIKEMEFREIAQEMAMTTAAVKTAFYRAMEDLKELVAREFS
jgi:RNA polymerase sigma factor (sigma-70 family)